MKTKNRKIEKINKSTNATGWTTPVWLTVEEGGLFRDAWRDSEKLEMLRRKINEIIDKLNQK
jgi:hypothetical protein